MSENPSVLDRIVEIIETHYTFRDLAVDSLTRLDHPNLALSDKVELLDFIMHVEGVFRVEISDEEIEKLHTVQDAVDLVNRLPQESA